MGKNKKRSIVLKILAVALAVFLVAPGLYYGPEAAQSPTVDSGSKSGSVPKVGSAPPVNKPSSYVVEKGQIVKQLFLTGELRAANSTMISAPDIRSSFSNMVTFLAPEGSLIKKGDRIVEFDDSSLLSSKAEAERTLDEAKLNIEKTKADQEAQRCDLLNAVAQAQATLKSDELYGKISKDLLPGNTYQQYQLNVQKSTLSLQKAREQLANFEKNYASQMALVEISKSQAEINLKQIVSDMNLLRIDAPQDGILIYGDNWQSNRKIQPGDTLFHGMEVANLPDLNTMQVVGYVHDTEYGSILRDARCSFGLDALPGVQINGRIISLTNVASRKSFASQKKVFQAVIQPDKMDTALMKPGMTARVSVPMVLARNVLTAPREYIGTNEDGKYYVIKRADQKKSDKQIVQLGAIGDRLIECVSGVSAGDTLLPVQE